MHKKLNLEELILQIPRLNEQEQRNTKGGGIWINGVYVSDYQLWLAEQYAITPDDNPWNPGGDGSNGGGDYDYGGGGSSSGGDGSSSSGPSATQIGQIADGLAGAVAIGSLSASISLAVDALTDAQYTQIHNFGKSLGFVGSAYSAVNLAISVTEEQSFDGNDALAAASIALGVAAIAFPPLAITLGTASFIMSIAVGTGVLEEYGLIDWGGY